MTTPPDWQPTCQPRAIFEGGSSVEVPADRPMRGGVLVLYFDAGTPWAANQLEHAKSVSRYSRFRVWNLNTRYGMPAPLAKLDVAAVVLHYSLFGAIPGPVDPVLGTPRYLLDDDHLEFLRTTKGRRIAILQDEQTYCRARFAFCDELGIDTVYTCLEPSEFPATWGRYTNVPNVRTTLPGYVDDSLPGIAARFSKPEGERGLDAGYRGRPMPMFMEPSQEKYEIGRRFAGHAAGTELRTDIGIDEEDRLYGDEWYRFIGECRTMLGVESGVSVVDCEDEVRNDYERILAEHGEVSLDELRAGPLSRWENAIRYRTISPRHFEAAAFGTAQILFEGEYSGAMRPMEHYIPLAKDFSNVDEVIERISDRDLCRELAFNARRDLIDSGDYGYQRFVDELDRDLVEGGADPKMSAPRAWRMNRAYRHGMVRRRHEPQLSRAGRRIRMRAAFVATVAAALPNIAMLFTVSVLARIRTTLRRFRGAGPRTATAPAAPAGGTLLGSTFLFHVFGPQLQLAKALWQADVLICPPEGGFLRETRFRRMEHRLVRIAGAELAIAPRGEPVPGAPPSGAPE